MTDKNTQVESELEYYQTGLNGWIESVKTITIPESYTGVVDRFIRDCNTLIQYIEEKETPQRADLVDFSERFNSLEIQYINISSVV